MMNPRRQYSLKEDLTEVAKLILLTLWIFGPILLMLRCLMPPTKFSLQLVGATATGLDTAAVDAPPPATISTVFNMTLHAGNRRLTNRCYSNGEVSVRYAGQTVAWARTMGFCVGAGEARDVPLVAWADGGAGWPPPLRERMAAAAAEIEVDVHVKLFRADDRSGRPAWLSCKVTTGGGHGGGGANSKPTTTTFSPCTTFSLQNWASDITDQLLRLQSLI